jgi:hypothetical protein
MTKPNRSASSLRVKTTDGRVLPARFSPSRVVSPSGFAGSLPSVLRPLLTPAPARQPFLATAPTVADGLGPQVSLTGANAGGRCQLPMRTLRAARVAQFCRWATRIMRGLFTIVALSAVFVGCDSKQTWPVSERFSPTWRPQKPNTPSHAPGRFWGPRSSKSSFRFLLTTLALWVEGVGVVLMKGNFSILWGTVGYLPF